MRVRTANPAFCRMSGLSQDQQQGRVLYELVDGRWDLPALRGAIERAVTGNGDLQRAEIETNGGRDKLAVNVRRVSRSGESNVILLVVET